MAAHRGAGRAAARVRPEVVPQHVAAHERQGDAVGKSHGFFGERQWQQVVQMPAVMAPRQVLAVCADAVRINESADAHEQRFIERAFKKIFNSWHDPAIQNLDPKLQPLKYISSEVAGNNTID